MTTDDSLADRLARYALETDRSALSDSVVDAVRKATLDWTGLVLGGEAIAESSASVARGVAALAGSGDDPTESGRATMLSTGESIAPDRAALVNGTYAHSLDFDDTHRSSSSHPGAPVIAAALAAAEATGAADDELLAAIAVGYDVTCGFGRAVNPDAHYGRGFHITATCGTFGATAAAGRLWGLSTSELSAAFGINGSQAAGSLQFLDNGAWNKRLHPGLAASRAIEAVALAAAGFRGASRPFTGTHGFFHGYTDNADPSVLDGLEPGAAVQETALKPYPCCRYMHAAIDGLLDIAAEEAIDPAAIESIHVDLPASGVTLTGEPIDAKRRPTNLVDCQFSMPFVAALALTEADAGLRAFLDAQDRLDEPTMRRLMDRTTVATSESVQSRFPETWAASVRVNDGSTPYERFVEHARGEPERPLSWSAIDAKFAELATAAGVADDDCAAIIAACRSLGADTDPPIYERLRGAVGHSSRSH
ncbi:MmgE/PrpD family protein [Halalkalirubrum salinum]|uniref:MmgE/PrpD family protein n=1 Tax=Halalkalirubrum salinum TaxID=2563889 RepID=UPI0010FADBB1|nr:MmgE/PrpD family protein [Halalkalirubrum salinum]